MSGKFDSEYVRRAQYRWEVLSNECAIKNNLDRVSCFISLDETPISCGLPNTKGIKSGDIDSDLKTEFNGFG